MLILETIVLAVALVTLILCIAWLIIGAVMYW